jgi:threonine synthase
MFGVTVGQNSAADKLYSKWNPQRNELDTMLLNEPQYNLWRLEDERLLLDTFALLETVGSLACEPSSAAAFAALLQLKTVLKPDERVLVINTGTFNFKHDREIRASDKPA